MFYDRYEYRVQELLHGGWDTIAGNSNRHSAIIMRDSLTPREDTTIRAFKNLKFRVVNSKDEVQE